MVINNRLVVFKRKKQDLENEISNLFDKIDNSYDYLLNIKTYQYTQESVLSLSQENEKTIQEIEILKNTHHLDMWKKDLKIYK